MIVEDVIDLLQLHHSALGFLMHNQNCHKAEKKQVPLPQLPFIGSLLELLPLELQIAYDSGLEDNEDQGTGS